MRKRLPRFLSGGEWIILRFDRMLTALGRNAWYLCDRNDAPAFPYWEFRGNAFHALQWLRQFQDDCYAMGALRRLFPAGNAGLDEEDEERLSLASRRLGEGSLRAVQRIELTAAALSPKEQGAGLGPAFPLDERRQAPPPAAAGADAPTFPPDIDPAAIADVQRAAASQGAPFCEECLRAAQAAGGQQ
jgi:hypothetical protein